MQKGFMLIEEEQVDLCMCCGEPFIIKYCKKYSGYIGKCPACGGFSRES